MERPTGVTVLAVLDFIGSACLVLVAIIFLVGAGFAGSMLHNQSSGGAMMLAGLGTLGAVFFFIGALVAGALGFGLWNLMNWARWITIFFAALGILGAFAGFAMGMGHHAFGWGMALLFRLAINGIIIWYLFQPNVRRAFGEAA